MFPKESTIRALIERWNRHYSTVLGIKSATERSERIAHDLYLVRNAGLGAGGRGLMEGSGDVCARRARPKRRADAGRFACLDRRLAPPTRLASWDR